MKNRKLHQYDRNLFSKKFQKKFTNICQHLQQEQLQWGLFQNYAKSYISKQSNVFYLPNLFKPLSHIWITKMVVFLTTADAHIIQTLYT